MLYRITVANATNFFDYAEKHAVALVQIHIGGKNPVGNDWPNRSSTDPAEWARWKALSFNTGVHAGKSRLITIDLDTTKEGGREGVWGRYAAWCMANGLPVYAPHVSTARQGMHIYFRLPDGVDAMALKASAKKLGTGIDVLVGNKQSVAPGSYYDGTAKGEDSGWYTLISDAPPHPAPAALIEHCTPRAERTVSSAPRTAALPEYDYEQVARWIDRKVAGDWKDDPTSPWNDQGEWIFFGKALKLHFPNEDGLALWMRATHDGHGKAAKRWDDPTDFKPDYAEGMRTLAYYTKRDTNWMFRDLVVVFDDETKTWKITGPQPLPSPSPIDIPAEILEQYKCEREQYQIALLGPLPDHSYLTAPQANVLVKFWAHLPSGKIIHEPSRMLWVSASFDKHVGRIKDGMTTGPGQLASTWASQQRPIHGLGWAPGHPTIVEDMILTKDGWIHSPGERSMNLYLPSSIKPIEGDVSKWLNLAKFIYPDQWRHIVLYFAYKVQYPGNKVNHGLVFIGTPGIGKDTLIEPVTAAIGRHNFASISATKFFNSDFNGYLKSILLRIDEVHDLGGESKYAFHDRTKTVLAAPPATHDINEKFVPFHSALNVCGTILTSNHLDALYLPPDDRRHYVCNSERTKEDFTKEYWDDMYAWFDNGGNEAVAYFLANLDLSEFSEFSAKAPPPKTAAWRKIVNSGIAPESGELNDIIEALGKPEALTLATVKVKAPLGSDLRFAFEDAKRRRAIPKRLAECGYVEVENPDARDSGGRWRVSGGKVMIYARKELSEAARVAAARRLALPPLPA